MKRERMTRRHFLEMGSAATLTSAVALQTGFELAATESSGDTASGAPNFEDYATIEAYCGGVPVYSIGDIAYIYGVSPDAYPQVEMQEANTNPKIKIKPKKSWEIKRNPFGVNAPEPGPRTMWDDAQPLLPIHLIDGDLDTIWSSYGCQVPDARPEWIRIDLPAEATITAVVLICSQNFADAKLWAEGKIQDEFSYRKWAGRALPSELTIQVSRDAWHWETVYENKTFSGNDCGPSVILEEPNPQNSNLTGVDRYIQGGTIIKFQPRIAKQVLITGFNFKRRLDKYDGYAFSLGEVEVWDGKGNNVALVSRGAGVTVSSWSSMQDHRRITQDLLFEPLQYDLGLKYIRVGADNGMYTWNYVEREKGKIEVDPVADRTVTNLHRNGLSVVMNLDVKANFAYEGRKLDWRQARIRELNNIYYDHPGWCWKDPQMFEAWLRYLRFMVGHFKDRVAYFEIGNEWSGPLDVYFKAVRTIKSVDPKARIMVGVFRMSQFRHVLERLAKEAPQGELTKFMPDAVGAHPNTKVDAGMSLADLTNFYWRENKQAIKDCNALGFKGAYIVSEVYSWALYPPGPRKLNAGGPRVSPYYGYSEMVRAKYVAQNLTGSAGLNMMAFYCNTYYVSACVGQSLCRIPVPSQTLSVIQPDPAYYMLRTLCTVLDDWTGAEFPVSFSAGTEFETFTFRRGKSEMMVASWIPGETTDGVVETKTDITLPGVRAEAGWVINIMNGTEQKLVLSDGPSGSTFKGILVKDYPTLLRVNV